jgi:ABC-type sugar transport system permease subunit
MPFIWSGLGPVVVVFAFIGYVLSVSVHYFVGWPVAAALNYACCRYLDTKVDQHAKYHDADGNVTYGPASYTELASLFFIPMTAWTFVFLILAGVLFFMSATGLCIQDGAFFSKQVACDRAPGPWF